MTGKNSISFTAKVFGVATEATATAVPVARDRVKLSLAVGPLSQSMEIGRADLDRMWGMLSRVSGEAADHGG